MFGNFDDFDTLTFLLITMLHSILLLLLLLYAFVCVLVLHYPFIFGLKIYVKIITQAIKLLSVLNK